MAGMGGGGGRGTCVVVEQIGSRCARQVVVVFVRVDERHREGFGAQPERVGDERHERGSAGGGDCHGGFVVGVGGSTFWETRLCLEGR